MHFYANPRVSGSLFLKYTSFVSTIDQQKPEFTFLCQKSSNKRQVTARIYPSTHSQLPTSLTNYNAPQEEAAHHEVNNPAFEPHGTLFVQFILVLVVGTAANIFIDRFDVDLIAWWRANEMVYPTLARMAYELYSIPSMSAEVERVFSRFYLEKHELTHVAQS